MTRRAEEIHALAEAFFRHARGNIATERWRLAAVQHARASYFYGLALRVDRDGWPMTHAETEALIRESWA